MDVETSASLFQVSTIREGLAELYEYEEQWSKAAQMLSGIDLESGIRYDYLVYRQYDIWQCVYSEYLTF